MSNRDRGKESWNSNSKQKSGNRPGNDNKRRSFQNERRTEEDKARQISSPENYPEASGSQNSTRRNQPKGRSFTISKSSNHAKQFDDKSSDSNDIRERVKCTMTLVQNTGSTESIPVKGDPDANDYQKSSNSSTSTPHSVKTESGTFECSRDMPDRNKARRSRSSNAEDSDGRGEKQNKGRSTRDKSRVREIDGDLFSAPENIALVHCVGADFRMGSGIALHFHRRFKSIGELLDQRKGPGDVAFIQCEKRYVFYLITKQASTDKPALETMRKSLLALREKCEELKTYKLAMPKIGCGLDELSWSDVKEMLEEIFADSFDITIHKLDKGFVDKPIRGSKSRVRNADLLLKDIEGGTGLLYIGCAKRFVSEEMKSIAENYRFLQSLTKSSYSLGSAFYTRLPDDQVVYGLICKESEHRPLSYHFLEAAIEHLRIHNEKHNFHYFGIQAFKEKNDPHVMEKIETLFRNSRIDAEFWICWPPALVYMRPSSSETNDGAMQVEKREYSPTRDERSSSSHPSNFVKQFKESKKNAHSPKTKQGWDNNQRSSHSQDRSVREVEGKMNSQSLADESQSGTSTFNPNYSGPTNDGLNTSAMEWSDDNLLAELPEHQDSSHNTEDGDWPECGKEHEEDERRKSKEKKERIRLDKEKEKQDRRSVGSKSCVTECKGDLFDAEKTMCLAHCVGADFRMGSGIAVIFRQEFGAVAELLDQRVDQGGVAYLKHGERYIFYLVTKRDSTGKPTYGTLKRSLYALHKKCEELKVTELAMPRIGCGLDRLEWDKVKSMLEDIFADGFSIKVYNLQKPSFDPNTSEGGRTLWRETDNQRMASILRDLQRTQESTYRKLTVLDDIKNEIFGPDGLKSTANKITAQIDGVGKGMQELASKTDIFIQEFRSFYESHESLRGRVTALETSKSDLEERVEFLEQRLLPPSSGGPGHTFNNGNYSYPGFPDGCIPILPDLTMRQICASPPEYYDGRTQLVHSGYPAATPQIYSSEQLPQEKEALYRAAETFAHKNKYEITYDRYGNILMRKDERHRYKQIFNHGDLSKLESF